MRFLALQELLEELATAVVAEASTGLDAVVQGSVLSSRLAMARSGRRRGPIALVAFALALGALLVQGGSLLHLHVAGEPAFFNLDHDLTLLATATGGAPVPADACELSLLPVVAAAPLDVVSRPAASPLRYSASRAPPLAS